MRRSLKGRILLLLTFVLAVQVVSYLNHFYLIKSELVERWYKNANVLANAISDRLSYLLEEKVVEINTLIAKYERMGFSPDKILWRLSGDINSITEGAFYDITGKRVAFSSRLKTSSVFEDVLSSLLEKT